MAHNIWFKVRESKSTAKLNPNSNTIEISVYNYSNYKLKTRQKHRNIEKQVFYLLSPQREHLDTSALKQLRSTSTVEWQQLNSATKAAKHINNMATSLYEPQYDKHLT